MATIVKTASGTWKAVVRKRGWPTTAKTFRLKRDTIDWARHTEDAMVPTSIAPPLIISCSPPP